MGNIHWYWSINEEGWHKNGVCLGYRPDLCKEHIESKVIGILLELSESEIFYISNGTEGDMLTSLVADRCIKENKYDQHSIVLFIAEHETPSHAEYWASKAANWNSDKTESDNISELEQAINLMSQEGGE